MPKTAPQTILNPSADSSISKNYSGNLQSIPLTGDNTKIYITDVFQTITNVVNNFNTKVGGANGDVQLNVGGKLEGDSGMRYDPVTDTLTVVGNVTTGNLRTNHLYYANGNPWSMPTAGTVTNSAQPNITSVGTLTSLEVSGNVTFGDAGAIFIDGGSAGQVLSTDGAGNLSWVNQSGGADLGDFDIDGSILQADNPIIKANDANLTLSVNTANWVFGSDSSLDFPTNLKIAPLSAYGPIDGTMMIQDANESVHILTPGNDAHLLLGWTSTNGLKTATIGFNADSDSLEGAKITAGNFSGTVHGWVFGADGNLTVPGNISFPDSGLTIDSGYDSATAGLIAEGGIGLRNTQLYNSGNIASQITLTRPNFPSAGDNFVQIALHEDNANAPQTWTFNKDGNLTLPGNTFAVKYANGSLVTLPSAFDGGTVTGQTTFTYNEDSTNTTTGAVKITHGLGVGGNVHTDQLHTIGNAFVGGPSLFVGEGADSQSLTNPTLIIFHAGSEYVQAAIKNSIGDGSADWVAYSDYSAADGSNGWADMGMTGSTFNDPNYTITGPGDGYFFVQARNGGGQGGNLVLATGDEGTTHDIVFATGGFDANNEIMRVDQSASTFYVGRTVPSGTNIIHLDVNGNLSVGGELSVEGNANLGNLVTANYFSGDGSLLTSITGGNVSGQVGNALIAGTVYTNAQPNITSLGTLVSLDVSGNITSGNANLGNLVVANYFSGDGSLLTSITGGNVSGQVSNALIASTVYTNAQPNITSVGTLVSLDVSGNITSGNANLGNLVVANYFSGDGSLLSNLNPANIGQVANANYAAYAGDVVNASQSNITSLGTLSSLNVTGNITSGNADLGNLVVANYFTGTLTTASQSNITAVGTLASLSVTGNISSGNATFSDFAKLTPGSAPSSPTEGMIYYDSTDHKLKVYTGSAWETISSTP